MNLNNQLVISKKYVFFTPFLNTNLLTIKLHKNNLKYIYGIRTQGYTHLLILFIINRLPQMK